MNVFRWLWFVLKDPIIVIIAILFFWVWIPAAMLFAAWQNTRSSYKTWNEHHSPEAKMRKALGVENPPR